MASASDTEFTQDILGCARCWGDGHKALTFRKLTHPVTRYVVGEDESEAEVMATHWSTCPTTGEPILMTFYDEDGEVQDA